MAQYPSDANQCVDEIVRVLQRYMQSDCKLKVNEVLKGGSLGQGTAIPGEFDLDLVVYSDDISNQDMLDGTVRTYIGRIQNLLSQRLMQRITNVSVTDHGLQFIYNRMISVDLLPSPYFSSANKLHEFLASLTNIQQRRMFSCSAAKWLKQFFSEQPPQVKEYIRKAKSWRNNKWPSKENNDGRPKSILISFLVIEAYSRAAQRAGGTYYVTDQAVTNEMKNLICDHRRLQVSWTDRGAMYARWYASELERSSPYIIDPSNPFNNLYISGVGRYIAYSPESTYGEGDGNWSKLVEYVDTLDLTQADGTL